MGRHSPFRHTATQTYRHSDTFSYRHSDTKWNWGTVHARAYTFGVGPELSTCVVLKSAYAPREAPYCFMIWGRLLHVRCCFMSG